VDWVLGLAERSKGIALKTQAIAWNDVYLDAPMQGYEQQGREGKETMTLVRAIAEMSFQEGVSLRTIAEMSFQEGVSLRTKHCSEK
jgi:hypothetical protein